jgi:glycosyl transferase family 25
MIPIRVISLNRSIERRKFIEKQFSSKGMSFSFFDAIDVKSSNVNLDLYFNSDLFEEKETRKASVGEIGNKISQYLVIEDFVLNSDEDVLIIFEDDAKILCGQRDLEELIQEFKNSSYDILVLGYSKCDDLYEKHTDIINPVLITNRCSNGAAFGKRYFHSSAGSVGFAIKREGAIKFLTIKPQYTVTDDWKYFNSAGFNLAYAKPMIVREELDSLDSTADHKNISLKPFVTKFSALNLLLGLRKYFIGYYRLARLILSGLILKLFRKISDYN